MIFKAKFPLPPSSNGAYPTSFKTKKRFKSQDYKDWLAKLPKLYSAYFDAETPCELTLNIWFKDTRNRDIGNYEKLIIDYLVEQGILSDDNFKILQRKITNFAGIDKKEPRIEVVIKPLPDSLKVSY